MSDAPKWKGEQPCPVCGKVTYSFLHSCPGVRQAPLTGEGDRNGPFAEVPSGISLAHWFWEETERRNPGCDGIALWREGGDYCYLWVEAMVDHDMWHSYLLDIRTSIGDEPFSETRDYLFLHAGVGDVFEVEWQQKPIRFNAPTNAHIDRLYYGLKWFADRVMAAVEQDATR